MAGVHLESRDRAVGFTFQVLGELKVFDRGQGTVPVTAGRQQVVLAALLLESGRLQNCDHLIRLLWAEDPPETARTQVQICVSRMRKTLAAAAVEAAIETRPPGYVLQIDDEALDLNVFRRTVAEAAALGGGGRTAEAAALLRAAVGMWRGPCLNGIPSDALARVAEHIDEERLAATESFIELELSLGRHHQLTAEIARLVGDNPLRERFRGQLMLALYRSGRQAEALESYREGRALLMDELGLQPGEDLRRLEQAVLTEDPSLRLERTPAADLRGTGQPPGAPAPDLGPDAVPDEDGHTLARAAVPRQLPVDTADFVGHGQLVAEAEGVLTNTSPDRAPGIVVVTGRSGIGKSTFAARVAHRLAESHFPDGQLYCQLRGGRADPVDPREVLGRFLRALGLPGPAIPDSLEERGEIYRSMLAARRILVVLDDAVGEEQIFPLLPGGRSCGVLVTSRARLTALPGAHRVTLDILDERGSLELIGNVVGADRVGGEPEAARALAAAVGGLPLALRIIAARLAARPHWPLASMVQRLADERRRLDELTHGEMTVRASLALTYDGLAERDRTLLRLLSLTKGSTFPSWIGGPLLDAPDAYPYPSDLMEPLVDVQMLDVAGVDATGELRYGFHDIIRLFARDRLAAESDETERRAAIRRVGGAWLALVCEAQLRVLGTRYFDGPAVRWSPPADHVGTVLGRPLEWLDTERENLSLTVESLAQEGEDGYAWELAVNLAPFFETRGYLDHWARTHRKALTAVRRSGNLLGQAALQASLGSLHLNRRNLPEARLSLTTAVGLFEELGHTKGLGLCRRDLGLLERLAGHDTAAMDLFEQAERHFGDDDPWARASVLVQRAVILLRRGDVGRVEAELDEALEIWRDLGYLGGQARVLQRAGQLHLHRGQPGDARKVFTESLSMVRDDGDVIGEGYLLHDLGRVHARLGELTQAVSYFNRALAVREGILDQAGAASVRVDLADLSLRGEDTAEAGGLLTDALEVFGRLGMAEEEERATGLLARVAAGGAAEGR
ncbi:BTAD domain-containing putative transcriptional regulator [Streptomyces sp. NPDC094468]|uniref:AfsR/SARP family transcriptional regulator n=1 Tax=Streptomyces sp. NPDC094468 TaxID=3366066 RepID=UPI003826E3BB